MPWRAPDWLTARPVAHRGLHNRARGIVENMPSAFKAAIAGNFAIELDIQLSADGEAMVHHDDTLGRLAEGDADLRTLTAAGLRQVPFKDTGDRMMTLGELCDLTAGRVPLVVEVKSRFDGDRRLVTRMTQVLSGYRGPVAPMSFDPDQVRAIRDLIPDRPRGVVAERDYNEEEWRALPPEKVNGMRHLAPFHRLLGQRTALACAVDRAQSVRLRAADLDRAHARAAPPRRAPRRPDDLRGVRAGTTGGTGLKSRLKTTIYRIVRTRLSAAIADAPPVPQDQPLPHGYVHDHAGSRSLR